MNRIQLLSRTAIAAFAVALGTTVATNAHAAWTCNGEDDTCIAMWQPDNADVFVYMEASGDYRDIRLSINGHYQGQFEESNYNHTFTNVQHNSVYDVEVQSCWRGFWGSTCHSWAAASIRTAPNARTFTNNQLVVLGKCVDLPAFNTANGTPIVLFDCNGGANQKWTLRADGSIHSAVDPNKCLDLPDFNTANKTGLEIFDCNGGANQIWSYENDDSLHGLGGKCMDLPASNTTNVTQFELYDCNGGRNQAFFAVP